MNGRTFDFGFGKGAGGGFEGRIASMALLTAVSVLLAASAVFIIQQWASEGAALKRHQASITRFTAQVAGKLAEAGGAHWPQDALAPLSGVGDVGGAYLNGPDGRTLAAYGEDLLRSRTAEVLESRAPVLRGGRPVGEVVVVSRKLKLSTVMARYIAVASALFFVATGLALFVAKGLAVRVTEPVRRLVKAMDQVAESNDFSQSVERIADDELGRLTDAFNALLRKLDANDQALRRTMGELVKARDAAEAANVSKSQFLSNMSHEIRTPLNGVLAMAQIMALGELSETQRERLDVVRQSGEALLAILNDVLDISKIEAGKMELELVEFELRDLALFAEAAYGEVARRKGLTLIVEVKAEPGDRRLGDIGRVRQIAANLTSNALKFTERGEVRLLLAIEAREGRDWLRLSVSDTGIGIAADKLPILFRKFTQVDSSTTRRYGGSGLGLAICAELAALMGGRMGVESQEGVGSTFYLIAPMDRASAAPARPRPQPITDPLPGLDGGQRLRVLAAEDNLANQVVLRSIMNTFGADLTLVADGLQAVEAWRTGRYDLILMDIMMPVMDGMAATRAIRQAEQDEGRAPIPIVALSANAMTHQVRSYLEVGMDMHLAKPIELGKIQALLRAVGSGEPLPKAFGPAEAAA
jgi:signal transduction histidine kinase/ActR/RegA family two-component response regulator